MLVVARDPLNHRAFLEFAILGNIVHAIIMAESAKNCPLCVGCRLYRVDGAYIARFVSMGNKKLPETLIVRWSKIKTMCTYTSWI